MPSSNSALPASSPEDPKRPSLAKRSSACRLKAWRSINESNGTFIKSAPRDHTSFGSQSPKRSRFRGGGAVILPCCSSVVRGRRRRLRLEQPSGERSLRRGDVDVFDRDGPHHPKK